MVRFFNITPAFTLFRYNFHDSIRNNDDSRKQLTLVYVVTFHGLCTHGKGNIFICAGRFNIFEAGKFSLTSSRPIFTTIIREPIEM